MRDVPYVTGISQTQSRNETSRCGIVILAMKYLDDALNSPYPFSHRLRIRKRRKKEQEK
jgi:hypothetical protein